MIAEFFEESPAMTQLATFAAGCFWGVEEAFRHVTGVKDVAVGYIGGTVDHPTYRQVCSGETGHAEAVQVEFNPEEVGYETLLETFWKIHDPTTRNRQGPDFGTQYRSAIFTHDEAQQSSATASKQAADISGRFPRPIVTEIVPATTFWRAEEYHQRYLQKHGRAGCAI